VLRPDVSCPRPDPDHLLHHRPLLRGIARRLLPPGESDDLVQEVWVRTLAAPCVPRDPRRLRGFLAAVTRNLCADWLRRRAREAPVPFDELQHPCLDRDHARTVARDELERGLALLPPQWRQVLLAFHRDGMSLREIAGCLGLSEAAVSQRLHRARQRARQRTRQRVRVRDDDRRRSA
jgi:RNA polymerase sigma-70 factor (ECF subfamily)